MWSLEQWLAYQAQVHPQTIDLGLDRLAQVLERLKWRTPRVPILTVAGTNGKGSVAAYCTAILTAAGHRVGTFTSPHLRDYRERIHLHTRYVTSQELVWAFERIEAARGESSLTFFEYNTLAALLLFEAASLDAWVLEIGMGGRLDAVNIVDPNVAVITSIGLDHQEYLGTSLEAIAREKAGVFRRARAAVLGSSSLPQVVETIADAVGARLKRPGIEYHYTRQSTAWDYLGNRWNLPRLPPPALWGDIQYENAATAIAAVEELTRLDVSASAVARGLRSVRLVGRFQVIAAADSKRPTWILDVAHNPDAAHVLAHNLGALPVDGRTLAVCGILADKDSIGIVAQLRDCIDGWWFAATEGERGSSGAALAERVAAQLRTPGNVCGSVSEACAAASATARTEDRIVVFGSFHTVGPALDWLEANGFLQQQPIPEYTAAPCGS
jgi:dihydrofolate synthase / folylpolyglutamate synthase